MKQGFAVALAGVALAITNGVEARAEFDPQISGEVVFELQNDWVFDSDDLGAEVNNLNATIEPDINLFLFPELFLNAHFTLEEINGPEPDENHFLQEHGIFLEALTLNYETDRFFVFGGKFGPNFSIAYDAAPGIYGTDISEDDIEMSERIGFGGGVSFGAEQAGTHTLSGSVFFQDTSVLSESAFTNRTRTTESSGGPSNTESLESFVVALDGGEFESLPGLRYHVAYGRQEVDLVLDEEGAPVAAIDDESRFAVAAEWEIAIDEDWSITPLVEYVTISNFGGTDEQDQDYLTAGAALGYGAWGLQASYTGRFIENADGTELDDFSFQLSASYTFEFGLEAAIGWKLADEGNVEANTLGAFLGYTLEF